MNLVGTQSSPQQISNKNVSTQLKVYIIVYLKLLTKIILKNYLFLLYFTGKKTKSNPGRLNAEAPHRLVLELADSSHFLTIDLIFPLIGGKIVCSVSEYKKIS